MNGEQPYALVLGGGGTKGAYQIGAWRAFRELGVSFHAIAGASVGALNAGLIAQNSFDLAVEIWNDLALDDIVSLPGDLLEREEKGSERERLPSFSELQGYLLKHHGLDPQPLHDLLHAHIEEDGIRAAGVDLGITTYELTNMRQVEIFLEEIPHGQLADYLLASASFPAFRATEIEGRRFTDGGIIDNIPYRMIKNRGYRRIVVVDVSGLGINRRPDIIGTQTVYIKNSMEMGSIMNFDPEFISSFMELGYLDTLRVFGRFVGVHYYLDEGPDDRVIARRLVEILTSRELLRQIHGLVATDTPDPSQDGEPAGDPIRMIRETLPKELREYREVIIPLAECAALSLNLERVRRYTLEDLINAIWGKAREVERTDLASARRGGYRSILELLKRKWSLLHSRDTEQHIVPYLYDRAFDEIRERHKRAIYLGALRRLYPALTPTRIFRQVLAAYFKES